jgi:hypothetical protein
MPLRPLSIGELLDRTFSLYRNNFVLFVGIMTVPQMFAFAGTLAMAAVPKLASQGVEPSSAAIAGMVVAFLGFLGLSVVHFFAYGIAQGATVYAVSQVYMERSTTIADSYRFMSKRIWPVLAVILLSAVAMGLGLIVFLVGAIFAFLFFSLSVPVCVLEGRDAIASMERSYALVKEDLAKIFLVCLVFYLIQMAAVSMVTYPSLLLGMMYGAAGPPYFLSILSALAQFVATSLATPLITIGVSLAYYDYRVRREALDLQMMMAALGPAPMAPAGIPSSPSGNAASMGTGTS